MYFVFIWEQTGTCATYSINWLVFITEIKSVYCAVRSGSLNKVVCASSLMLVPVQTIHYLSKDFQSLVVSLHSKLRTSTYSLCLILSSVSSCVVIPQISHSSIIFRVFFSYTFPMLPILGFFFSFLFFLPFSLCLIILNLFLSLHLTHSSLCPYLPWRFPFEPPLAFVSLRKTWKIYHSCK